MQKDFMPQGGVKELVKTKEGRRYLARLQKKYEIDLIQPNDPRFEKIYGAAVRKRMATKQRQERLTQEEWKELQERKKRDAEGRKIF